MADTAPPPATDANGKARPEKPDEAKYKADLAKAEKDHEAVQARFNAARTKLDSARGGKSTPANDRFKALVDEQKSIRTKQSENKNSKREQQDKFNKNDVEIKKLFNDQKETRARLGFKSADELEAKVASIERQIESGTLKVVEEKKALVEIREIRKQKPKFGELEQIQRQIDEKKNENAELKKTFDNPESRALAQKYEDNQKELDGIKAAREDTNKNYDTLKAEREKLYQEQQTAWTNIKKVKDEYYGARKAFKEYEDQVYQQRRERQKAERDSYEKEKRRRVAEQKLEEAGEPAFLDQIRTAEGLIRYFDPSYTTEEGDKGHGQYAASAQRTIDDSGFKGMKVVKKVDEDFFAGSGGKKKGKGKKGGAAGAESGKLNLNIGIIEELAKVGVDPPSTQADNAAVVEKLKEKLAGWKKDQDSQTQKNIEKAKKEIEKLEKEAEDAAAATPDPSASKGRRNQARKPALKETGVNGGGPTAEAEEAAEKGALEDATKDLKEASLEDKKNTAVETA